ncbi:MAG: NAD(P)H-dependent oxidoreductase [Duganella sp.]
MTKRILLIEGHPDAGHHHLCDAIELAYGEGALERGHEVRRIHIADLRFPLLPSQAEWEDGQLPTSLHAARDDIRWAEHIVFFFPLWLGDMPALLKGFLEQIARPGFSFGSVNGSPSMLKKGLLSSQAKFIVNLLPKSLINDSISSSRSVPFLATKRRQKCLACFHRISMRFSSGL